MDSIFDAHHNAALLARIGKLTPQTKAVWGRMNVAQMLAHAQKPLLVATAELELKRGLIGILFGGWAKRSLLKDSPFGRNGPTAPAFVIRGDRVFEEERAKLVELVQRFGNRGPAVLSKQPHPFFGPLTVAEWDRLQWKHLDHHLRQFGG